MTYDHSKYTANYTRENYDQVIIKIPKGKKALLKQTATDLGIVDKKGLVSVTKMIVVAVEEKYGLDLSKPDNDKV